MAGFSVAAADHIQHQSACIPYRSRAGKISALLMTELGADGGGAWRLGS